MRVVLIVLLLLHITSCGMLTRWRNPELAPSQVVVTEAQVGGLLSILNGTANTCTMTVYKPETLVGADINVSRGDCQFKLNNEMSDEEILERADEILAE